ncbi:putative thioredoxin reductase glit-like protein [Xylariaceae sp. FL1651]|nr:putative thioredoxin reductase glit-like protein [Xylariaceae sp. FL1651]
MPSAALYDALVVGAGPAGLSAALTLSRALQTAVVFDSGVFRNQRATHMHTLPTWDHHNPSEFRAAARTELSTRYNTVRFHDSALQNITKVEGGGFEATSADGLRWRGRSVVLATGVRDVLPDIKGYDSCWVHGIFHCLFCHGYEERGASSAGVLAIGDIADIPPALHLARAAKQLADKVTIYTGGASDLAEALNGALKENEKSSIVTDTRTIAELEKASSGTDVTIHFSDGSSAREVFLVHRPKTELNGPFAQQLALELTPQGDIQTTPPFGETSVPGVFAAGDCASMGKIVANAISTGAFAGAGATAKLQASVL